MIIGIVLRGRFWEVVMGTRGGGSFGSKMPGEADSRFWFSTVLGLA